MSALSLFARKDRSGGNDPNSEPESNVAKDARYLTDQNAILDCFKEFRDQRVQITIRVDGNPQTITCRVLDVTDSGYLIEDINPRSALADLRRRPEFSLSVRGDGTYAFIEDARITDEGQERGLPYFHVPFPSSMLFQQRRKSARYKLPMRVTTSEGASITLFREREAVGRILDISAGGCRVAFALTPEPELKIGEHISDCAIAMPPVLEIHSEGVVRHFHTRRDGWTVVGIELVKMHVTDRRRLEQFIQTLARNAELA